MSFEAMLAVQKLGVRTSHACFRVLLTVAEHANREGGNSWASIDTMAGEAQMDRKTVRQSLDKLVQAGLLTGQKGRGRGRVTVWALAFPVPPLKRAEAGVQAGDAAEAGAQTGVQAPVKGGLTPPIEQEKGGLMPPIEPGKGGLAPPIVAVNEGVSAGFDPVKGGLAPPEPKQVSKKEGELRSPRVCAREPGDTGFETWWDAYPRKVKKGRARRAYAAAVGKGMAPAELLAAVQRQRWPAEMRWTPHPATWLNDESWDDDPSAACPVESVTRRTAMNGGVELLLRTQERAQAAGGGKPAIRELVHALPF